MTRRTELLPLLPASPGTRRHLLVHRYGAAGARPKAYIQAALHADEVPGMLVVHHLLPLLDAAAAAGRIAGEIVVVPAANPVGLGQWSLGAHQGRFETGSGGNFNRDYADLTDILAERVGARLGADAGANVALIRAAMAAELAARRPASELDDLRLKLLAMAIDADIALDLHCDWEALCYFFTGDALWPSLGDLAADIGAEAVLLARHSGGDPFDEALSAPWADLAERFPGKPIPPACASATVELRGMADVDDAVAKQDAAALLRFLTRRGVIAGEAGPLPAPRCQATPLDGADSIKAPAAGIIVFRKNLGDRVAAGEAIADIVDPMAEDAAAARTPVLSRASGILYARARGRLARPGLTIGNVAGTAPLRGGKLLEA